jgi:spermidine synthase
MSDENEPAVAGQQRFLPVLLLLFFGSGCAALIYEVVWFQMLQLVIGSSVVSLGVLLGTFMGGMCLGSYFLPRILAARLHPLRAYAFLEIGIGVMGLLILAGMPLVNYLYAAMGGHLALRALFALVCLLPPTLMMGATLPAIARWVEVSPSGVSWLGLFYGGNIGGAVAGSLLAGFYLLRVFDMTVATLVAVVINAVVAGIGLMLARRTPYQPAPSQTAAKPAPGARAVYLTIGLSGMTALSAEVIWTRIMSLTFGATVYTFSLILAVFLFGLGMGSSLGAAIARRAKNPRVALGWCQMLLCGAWAWAAYLLCSSYPYWPVSPSISTSPWFTFQLDFMRAFAAVVPGAILWGASFPLALASVAVAGQDPSRLVGGVYAANTVGAILGSLLSSVVFVVTLGSQRTQQLMVIISVLSGLLMLGGSLMRKPTRGGKLQPVLVVVATLIAVTLARSLPGVPDLLIAFGRNSATWVNQVKVLYRGEGLNAFVAVSETPSGVRNYHNAGKVQASSQIFDMRLQRILGHMTHLIPRTPKRVLVIGCGAGVTAGAVSIGPGVERETIAEIESLVPRSVETWFSKHNNNVLLNPKVNVHIDDARHYLLTTKEKFDAITSDPLDPWVKGAATLYTQEFFENAKDHLNPGGAMTLWVQLYENSLDAVKSEMATFFKVFPHGVVWSNSKDGAGNDMVLLGQNEPIQIDLDQMEGNISSPEYAPVAQSLREIGINSAIELFSTYAGSAEDLRSWLADAQINRDRNLRLQYLAGMSANLYRSAQIYADMVRHARYPEGMFTGSPLRLMTLREGIERNLRMPLRRMGMAAP